MVRAAIALLFLICLSSAAFAEKRIALLIGNKDYKAGVGALVNPLNDIRVVADALKTIGFEVLKPTQNASRAAMLRAIHDFAGKLKAAGPDAVGFLYYSGHGIASSGENYLIPVDVEQPSTVELAVQGVKHSEVLAILRSEAPNAAHYLVLDACRNTLQGTRGGGKGFMPVGQQSGVLVAFAAEPGKTASDTGSGSGPYAAALAAELVKPGQNDLLMFHNVRVAVIKRTGGDQVPWTEDGIQREQRVVFGREIKPPSVPEPPKGPFDGMWTIRRLGPSCPNPDTTFLILIDNSVATGHAGGGALKGSVSKTGGLDFSHPTSQDVRQFVSYSGTLLGPAGKGTFKGGGSCQGTFTAARRTQPETSAADASEAERTWPWVKDSADQAVLENFIKQFGRTPFAALARVRLEELKLQQIEAERKRVALLEQEQAKLRQESKRPSGSQPATRQQIREFSEIAGNTVYFSFGEPALLPEAEVVLRRQAEWLQRHPVLAVTIEGHDDERNTRNASLALAAKRASMVRDFLIKNGVDASRIMTISQGSGQPKATCHDESCWILNRRTETILHGAQAEAPAK